MYYKRKICDDALEGLDLVKKKIGSVLFDPKTKQIYIPNTNKTVKMGEENKDDKQIDENNKENKQQNSEEAEGGEQIEE